MPTDDPIEHLKATIRGAPDTDAGLALEQVRRVVRRALRPGCPPSTLTRWIRAKAAELHTSQLSDADFEMLVQKVAAEIVAHRNRVNDQATRCGDEHGQDPAGG